MLRFQPSNSADVNSIEEVPYSSFPDHQSLSHVVAFNSLNVNTATTMENQPVNVFPIEGRHLAF